MSPRHCSDELLLELLDGEVSRRAEAAVRKHLKTCWECRARLTELEQQAEAVAKAFAKEVFSDPGRIAEAESTLFDRMRHYEQTGLPASHFRLSRIPVRTLSAMAACVALCLLGLRFWVASNRFGRADEVVAGTQRFEAEQYTRPLAVHQVFRVEVREMRPQPRSRTSRLEVWSAPPQERFAMRWRDSGGDLRYAVWRPEAGREYVYNPAAAARVARRTGEPAENVYLDELLHAGPDLERLEAGFLRWLSGRRWRPISFASEFRAFSDGQGTVLRVARVRSLKADSLFRLSARRESAGRRVEVVLEVDAQTYRPRLHSIRLETLERAVELRLAVDDIEVVAPARLTSVVFEPDLSLAKLERKRAVPEPTLPEPRTPARVAVPLLGPSVAELDAAEMEARYVLHRARACLGEPLQILRESGRIRILGLAQTVRRRQELLNALADLRAVEFVTVDIQTVAEAVSAAGPASRKVPGSAEFVTAEAASRQESGARFSASTLPIEDQLRRYFQERRAASQGQAGEKPESIQRMIAELSETAVSLSEDTYIEAWALRRLAERYARVEVNSLRPQSRWLLQVMVTDHITSLRERTARSRALLEPVLSSIAAPAPAAGGQIDLGAAAPWTVVCLDLFQEADQIYRLVRGLLAGSSPTVETAPNALPGAPLRQPEEVVADLLAAFRRLGSDFQRLEAHVNRDFSGNPDLFSSAHQPE